MKIRRREKIKASSISATNKKWFSGIRGKLLIWFLLLSLLPAAILSILNYEIALSKLESAKREDLKHTLSGAITVANALDSNVKLGTMSIEQAQEIFRTKLLGFRSKDGKRDTSQSLYQFNYGESFFAFNKQGKLVMDADQEDKDLLNAKDSKGNSFVQDILKQERGEIEFLWPGPGGEESVKVAAITSFGAWDWVIGVAMDKKEFNAASNQILWTSILIFFITAAIVLLLSSVAAKQFIRPLLSLQNTLEKIGQGDLTPRIEIIGKDELAALGYHLNHSLDSISAAFHEVVDSANQVAGAAQQLTANAEQSFQAVANVNHNVKEITNSTQAMNDSTQNISSVVEELVASIEEVTATTDDVSNAAVSMQKSSEHGREMIEAIMNKMQEIEKVVMESANKVDSLSKYSKEIGKMGQHISSIAGQTNLLALNAAIEAARAGEAGQGFAVVATEVRKLADQSNLAAHEIAELLKHIDQETKSTVHSMVVGRETVSEGSKVIEETRHSFEQIMDIIQGVGTQIKEVAVAMGEMAAGADSTVSSINQIVTLAEASADNAQAAAELTEGQRANAEQIQSATNELSRLAESLSESVGKFKV